jgi:hypothetical protein
LDLSPPDAPPPADVGRTSRRAIVRGAGSLATLSALAPPLLPRARAARRTLRILQWNHFVPAFDEWFNRRFIREWGEKNDTEVVVTNVGMTSIEGRAATEIARRQGRQDRLQLFCAGVVGGGQVGPGAQQPDQVQQPLEIQQARIAMALQLALAVGGRANPLIEPSQFCQKHRGQIVVVGGHHGT